jgi:hypothetical protein
MVRRTLAGHAHGRRRRVTSRERRRMMRRAVMRSVAMVVRPVGVVRTVVTKDASVQSMSRVLHLVGKGVHDTLDSVALLDNLHGRGRRGRVLLAQLLGHGGLPLLDEALKLEDLLVQGVELHQLDLELLLGVLKLVVRVLPDGRRVGVVIVLDRDLSVVLGGEGHRQTPDVGRVADVRDADGGRLLEGHPEGGVGREGHVVEGADVEAQGLGKGHLAGSDALKVPFGRDDGVVVEVEGSHAVSGRVLGQLLAVEADVGGSADIFRLLHVESESL